MFEEFMKPLERPYCNYYYILGLFGLFFFLYAIGVLIMNLLTRKDTMNVLSGGVLTLASTFMMYFTNRLLYSMCAKSL